ncbi:MAG: threonine ammonia-lyase IlvA [Paracoccaceae bacterium]|jgi:threonine dehydratase|nr:threonine ammonia-lyase IlvA [Paracoccaceae bacterium]HAG26433.1 threonine dehydratase [Rhodobacter sp.]MDP5333207.1 threonine ammonia-lyase IlvA [Paracoccaceae bacterium]MDP5351713.1 threonine ammonia-lyase IlvA [Paracoccaceae bacterium]MDP5354321.1 threonine ammonia-lyase IlvA [Paracoccaceae bacterium]|tara:strand:- start:1919 stop:3166 length:1248 start_codon:yes stop_codon:yes gene_type:complete
MNDFCKKSQETARALRKLFDPTPLQRNDYLSVLYEADIWLKREDLSPVRSYKLRGAFNAMRKFLANAPSQTHFVCASAGNHAQGVAYACRYFGVRGTIFMPVTTPQQKIDKTRNFGAGVVDIVLLGDYFDQTLLAAQGFCQDKDAHFLSPFDDNDVIEGQATVAVELYEQLGKAPDLVILPVGGGGLSAGVTSYLREVAPHTAYYFVEPKGGASMTAALAAGHPVALSQVNSFVDGAAVARMGEKTFERLKWVAPEQVLLAPEDRICMTMLMMLNIEGIVLEPAGALSVDVLPQLAQQIKGKTVILVTSGGNFDFERLPEVKERAQRFAGLKKYLILRMPQRPGALREFLSMLGPDDDIARFEYLKKSARNFGSVLIGIETKNTNNFTTLFALLEEAGFPYRDITSDETISEFLI